MGVSPYVQKGAQDRSFDIAVRKDASQRLACGTEMRELTPNEPLSNCLRQAIHVARESEAKDFERWLRLELGGYFASNSAMGEDIVVPEYRTVVGQHVDVLGRVLILPSDFSFVNETRLRNGAEELEALVTSRDVAVIHDPHMCELIKEHLKVEVYSFRFSTIHLTGVLVGIRTEFEARLSTSNPPARKLNSRPKGEDIIQLRPNLYGIGIDLRAIWRRWKGSN